MSKMQRPWDIIGAGSGWGARDRGTAEGAKVLMENMPDSFRLCQKSCKSWHGTEDTNFLHPYPLPLPQARIHQQHIFEMAQELTTCVKKSVDDGNLPLVLGGDHSTAIGTWAGVKAALGHEEMGLIWVDAHMDAHTPATSPSLNIHGMPVAILLGYGEPAFIHHAHYCPKVRPENLFLMGVRNFEEKEAALLDRLGVRIYHMQEIRTRGFAAVFKEVREKLGLRRFGLSIDVDAFDPQEAPGTGTHAPHGLHLAEVRQALQGLAQDPAFLALEVAEFNPYRDINDKTSQLIWKMITFITERQAYEG